ncbi:DUF3649 domain-containing protein [Pseudomonas sp. dw_358]|uniref:DUF3649 domain-containing protein n=1 Tax=Pseudomonas sp. dw_358 TaxID=2720083 RepID=UPI001BD4574E|nr:DUF3649 domain-containing protein [Pseudomonas sp. dw_358]
MAKPAKPPLPLAYRLGVLSRLLAATLGGYGVTTLCVSALASGLGLARGEAVLAATLPAFVGLALLVIWVFAARTAWLAWLGVLIPAAILLFVRHGAGL